MPIHLDTRCWPLVLTSLSGDLTDEDFRRYCEEFEQHVLGRRSTFVSLVDATAVLAVPSASQRKYLAEWQARTEHVGIRYNIGIGMVISSALIRGALTALNWVYRPSVKTATFATRAEAKAFLEELLAQRDLVIPSSAHASLEDVGVEC